MQSEATIDKTLKMVAVGDDLVGKSCAIANFQTAEVPAQRQSTVFDSSTITITIDGAHIPLQLWDTTGKSEYREMVKSVYQGADIFLIFFSVVSPQSYQNAVNRWYSQVNEANGSALKVFVGNKIDLRRAAVVGKVVQADAVRGKVEQQLKCKYLECSAMTGEGLREVFEHGVRELLHAKHTDRAYKKKKDGGCCNVM